MGPVDGALRQALGSRYPALKHIHLVDYRVRVLKRVHGSDHPGADRFPLTQRFGPPSAFPRTSSRRHGRLCPIPSSTVCCNAGRATAPAMTRTARSV